MKPNFEKEVSLLNQKLQEETTLRIRYQAILDDTLLELEQYKNKENQKNEKYHVVEGE